LTHKHEKLLLRHFSVFCYIIAFVAISRLLLYRVCCYIAFVAISRLLLYRVCCYIALYILSNSDSFVNKIIRFFGIFVKNLDFYFCFLRKIHALKNLLAPRSSAFNPERTYPKLCRRSRMVGNLILSSSITADYGNMSSSSQ